MGTEFTELHDLEILSTYCLIRAPISVLRNVLAAGSFLIPFQVVGGCKDPCRHTLHRTLSLHINGGGKTYVDSDIEKPVPSNHFPEGTECLPWLFIICVGT